MTENSFQTILDECLLDVLRGTRTIEQCLELYPDHAADLKLALQIALLTSRLKSPEMPARSVDRLENRLRQQMVTSTRSKVIHGRFAPFGKLAAMIAIIFLVALGSGAVTASANAVPGDWLYGLKRLWEAIVLTLTPLTGQVDDLWLQMTDRRLDEVEELAQRGQLSDSALYDLYLAMGEAIRLADAETTPNLITYLTEAQVALTAIQPPPQAESLYADLMLLAAPAIREDGSLEPPPVSPPSRSITPTMTSTVMPTVTITPHENREILPTLTATSTETMTATSTSTPRVPSTATRTPTPTNTPALPTATNTPSPTSTATWTPLPLPTLPGSTPITQPTAPPPDDGGIRPTNTPDTEATVRVRETEMSVYLTQTAGPAPTEASAP